MGVYENEDIRGAYIEEEVVCMDCLTDEERNDLKEKDLITTEYIEDQDKTFFCDRCGKEL